MTQKTVSINGREYDTSTGMLIIPERQAMTQTSDASTATIRKFAPHPVRVTQRADHPADLGPVPRTTTAEPRVRPSAVRKLPIATMHRETIEHKPSQVLKKEAIDKALSSAKTTKKHKLTKTRARRSRRTQRLGMLTGGLAVLLIGAYFTYLSMPALSVRVAASQAGINASYPGYHPDGYRLDGPVAYSPGQVSLQFASNGGGREFTLAQTNSNWDSSAVLENYVQPKVGDEYSINRAGGLTIYTYGTDAAWVSGGILYTVSGNAPLSPQQISSIATSM